MRRTLQTRGSSSGGSAKIHNRRQNTQLNNVAFVAFQKLLVC